MENLDKKARINKYWCLCHLHSYFINEHDTSSKLLHFIKIINHGDIPLIKVQYNHYPWLNCPYWELTPFKPRYLHDYDDYDDLGLMIKTMKRLNKGW